MSPKLDSAIGSVCLAASENHFMASAKSCFTTSPSLNAMATRVCALWSPCCACRSKLGHSRTVRDAELLFLAADTSMERTQAKHVSPMPKRCKRKQSTFPPVANGEGIALKQFRLLFNNLRSDCDTTLRKTIPLH